MWFEGRMIKERSKTVFTFEADTVVEVNQVKFLVCKYHYDEEQTEDAGCNYYWVTGIGMVCFSSTAWDITYRLFSNDSETDKAIAGIVGSIQNWKKKLK